MLDWMQLIFLALIQGLSEFLPISSSAHLVLPAQFLGWTDQGLLFDVSVHVGTLLAVLIYFRSDLVRLMQELLPGNDSWSLWDAEIWKFGVATVPAVLMGLLFSDVIASQLRGLQVIAATTLVFGVLLGLAAWRSSNDCATDIQPVTWRDAVLIGMAQAMALVPGVSRSGVTLTVALLLGYNRATAARFAFLMSIPIIVGAMVFMSTEWLGEAAETVPVVQLLSAMMVSAVSAYATIAIFLGLLTRVGLMPFVVYRLALGIALVLVIVLA